MSSFLSAVSSLMLPPLHVVLDFFGIAICLFQSREKCLGNDWEDNPWPLTILTSEQEASLCELRPEAYRS